MKIEFLMTDLDIISFIDYIYDSGLIVFRNIFREGKKCLIPLSKDAAATSLCADLLVSSRPYAIGGCEGTSVINLWSCNRYSHPRFASQMGREAGYIFCETQDDALLFASIKTYFRTNYISQKYGKTRFRCYFGPDYQELDSSYLRSPEPKHFCCGFIRMECLREYSTYVHNVLLNVLGRHPELSCTGVVYNREVYSREKVESNVVELVTGILLDRSEYDMDQIIQIAQELACHNYQLKAVRETRYEQVLSMPVVGNREQVESNTSELIAGLLCQRNQNNMEPIIQRVQELASRNHEFRALLEKGYKQVLSTSNDALGTELQWHIQVFVTQEWKGFGNFCTPCTWLV